MQRMSHVIGIAAIVAGGVVAVAVAQTPTAIDKAYMGTWKLNIAKSTYTPGPPPKEVTRIHEDRGGGFVLVITDGVNAQGVKTHGGYVYKPDGKEYPVAGLNQTGSATNSLVAVDPYTVTFTQKTDGKITGTGRRVVSKDGKTMTITTTGTNAQGQATSSTQMYDKQ